MTQVRANNPTEPSGLPDAPVKANYREVMAAYDAAPPRVRMLIAYAPLRISPLSPLFRHNPVVVERYYWDQLDRVVPGWRPFRSDPIP